MKKEFYLLIAFECRRITSIRKIKLTDALLEEGTA